MTECVLYPGTFDPVTNGHIDLIERSKDIFDKVIVGVATGDDKTPLFTPEERVILLQEATRHLSGISVECFEGLLVDYLKQKKMRVVVRGLRAISDFEYEFQMALTNRQMLEEMKTIFLMPSQEYIFLSSRVVKTVAQLGGDVSAWVPPVVNAALKKKYSK